MTRQIGYVIGFAVAMLVPVLVEAELGYHSYRHIHINGSHLSDEQILELEQMLSYEVPSGFYWLNGENGTWGYEGSSEVQGSIYRDGDPRRTGADVSQESTPSRESRPYIDTGPTGSAVINPEGCSYVTVGGMTYKDC